MHRLSRRQYLRYSAAVSGLAALSRDSSAFGATSSLKIALGEYSFNSEYRAGKYNPLELASLTRKRFELGAIDYVSSFWADKARDKTFLSELKGRAADAGVVNHLILVDLPGPQLGDSDASSRAKALEAHRPWLPVAQFLGCSGIRVNLNGFGRPGPKKESLRFSVEGYGNLLRESEGEGIDVLVQNHLGYSCDPDWLIAVMKQVNHTHAGIEADPGHFQELFVILKASGGYDLEKGEAFDVYDGWAKLMPFAKALNAKTHNFDAQGNETTLDYGRLLEIAKKAGYAGYIGIEWEPEGSGTRLSSSEGIEKTKALLEKNGAARL